MRKDTSTNTINKNQLEVSCGMAYTMSVIGGRWKLSILGFLLSVEQLRFSALRAKMPGISERMLVKQLRELEADGLINRVVYPEVPPKVEYSLSEKGRSLEDILVGMSAWGENNR